MGGLQHCRGKKCYALSRVVTPCYRVLFSIKQMSEKHGRPARAAISRSGRYDRKRVAKVTLCRPSPFGCGPSASRRRYSTRAVLNAEPEARKVTRIAGSAPSYNMLSCAIHINQFVK